MMVDFDNEQIKVKMHDEKVSFNIFKAMKHSKDKGIFFQIDAIEESIEKVEKQIHNPSSLEQALTYTYEMLGEKEEQ